MMIKTKMMTLGVLATMAMTLSMFITPVANAQFNIDTGQGSTLQVGSETNLTKKIFAVIKGVLSIVFAVAVLVFVVAGLIFLTSNGGERADLARDMLTYAIIGLVVSVLGYAAVVFISNALVDKGNTSATVSVQV